MGLWFLEKFLEISGLIKIALAQRGGNPGPISITLINPISACTGVNANFGCVATKIVNALFYVAIPIVSVMILIGAFQILISAGNPEKIQTGKRTILWAVAGFAIIIVGLGITSIIQDFFGIP